MEPNCDKSHPKKWKKVLYEDQGFPDYYVHESFMSELKINEDVKLYGYWELVFSTVVITQQLCVVCLFILSWWFMGDKKASPDHILLFALFLSLVGYIVHLKINQFSFSQDKVFNDFKTAVLLLGFTAFFSPVLETLTHTISTDTIYTMATLMLLGHFVFHDYDVNALFASRSVSLNMSVFASVCLASRLNAVFPTFVTVVLAFILFGLWPPLRRSLWKHKPMLLHLIAVAMYVTVSIGFLLISFYSFVTFLLVLSCIIFVFPALLSSQQYKKSNINGPWDEAVI